MTSSKRLVSRKRRGLFSALASVLAILLTTSSVFADLRSPWYSYSEDSYLYTNYTTWTSGDTHRTRITNILWGSTYASKMHHMASEHGNRFTLDVHDLNENMSALNTYWTNLPQPYFDRDFYASKCPEAEITSESASFPTAGSYYFGNFYFTHWYWIGGGLGWAWNNASGTYEYGEQLSAQYWWTSDKWDAATPDYGGGALAFIANHNYPAKARPGSNPPASADPCGYDGGPTLAKTSSSGAPGDPALGTGFVAVREESSRDVRTVPDLSRGLSHYRVKAHALARSLVATGPGRAIITFAEPVTRADLARLDSSGLTIHSFEAVSTPGDGGLRMTFGDSYGPEAFDLVASLATEEAVEMLGVTSVEATVPNEQALKSVLRDSDVFLVDMSAEQVRRSDPGVEAGTNDIYWFVAGWEPLPSGAPTP